MPSPLRISSLNVWALPGFIASDVPDRMQAIINRVGEADMDVAAFQEVWTGKARRLLVAGGRRIGLVPVGAGDDSPGGLLVLARYPVRRSGFTQYRLAGLPQRIQHGDYYGRKGFLEVELETPAGPVVIVTTHLHARYSAPGEHDEYLGMRAAQVAQLAVALNEIPHPCVAVGDFNFREDGPEYAAFVGLTGFVDAAAELDRRFATSLLDNPYHGSGHHPEERIDYVFARPGATVVRLQRAFDEPLRLAGGVVAYSDHAGLVAEIEIGSAVVPRPRSSPNALDTVAKLLDLGRVEAWRRRRLQRRWGGALVVASLLLRLSRDRSPGLPGAAAAGALLMAERMVGNELRGYDEIQHLLNRTGTD